MGQLRGLRIRSGEGGDTIPRAAATSGSMSPPKTTIPTGGGFAGSHGENRLSIGISIHFPSGVTPQNTRRTNAAIAVRGPSPAKRVKVSVIPDSPTNTRKFGSTNSAPIVLERTKYNGNPQISQPFVAEQIRRSGCYAASELGSKEWKLRLYPKIG